MYTFRLLHAIQQKSQCKYTHYTHSSSSSNSSSSIVYINTPYRIVQTFADSIYITHIRIYVRRIVVTNKSSRLCQLTSISPFNVFSLFPWKRFNADSIGTDRYVECFWFTLLLLFYVVNLMIRLTSPKRVHDDCLRLVRSIVDMQTANENLFSIHIWTTC